MKTYLGHSAITECQIDRLTSAAPHHNFQTTFGANIVIIIIIIITQCHSPTWEKEHFNPTLVVVVFTAIYFCLFFQYGLFRCSSRCQLCLYGSFRPSFSLTASLEDGFHYSVCLRLSAAGRCNADG